MKVLISVLILCTIMFFVSCSLLVKEEVRYEVSGSPAKADITYTDKDGTDEYLTDVTLPWQKTITITHGDDIELDSISLTASYSSTTDLTIKITWDK